MPRTIDASRAGAVVLPLSLAAAAGRGVDAQRAAVVIVYPDGTTGGELAAIIEAAAGMVRAVDDLDDEEGAT